MSNLKNKFLFTFLIGVTVVLFIFVKSTDIQSLKINEVAYSLSDGVDWIEIYNPTIKNISLSGFYLTDNEDKFSKFKFPEEAVIPAGGYLVVYGEDYQDDSGNSIVLNFNLSSGEVLYLVDRDGSTIVDRISLTSSSDIDGTNSNFSIARVPDGNKNIISTTNLTPGSENLD